MKGLRKGHREGGSETHVPAPFQQRVENFDKWTISGGARMQEGGRVPHGCKRRAARMQEVGCCTDARGGVLHGCKR